MGTSAFDCVKCVFSLGQASVRLCGGLHVGGEVEGPSMPYSEGLAIIY